MGDIGSKKGVMREEPREPGEETEFFLQSNESDASAFTAHIHNAAELLYVKEGSYLISLDDVPYEIGEGDLILFCSGAIHHGVTHGMPRNSHYVIKIPPSLFIDSSKREGVRVAMRFAVNHASRRCLWRKDELSGSEVERVLGELISEYEGKRYASEIAIRLKIMELLLAIMREDAPTVSGTTALSDRTAEQIYDVMNVVSKRFYEDIDERALAREYGMSYCYFSRSFKRVTGMTFKSYLNRTRISRAERLLMKNDSTISEIASACGYNSVSYFISVYRTLTGKTPYQSLLS